MTKSITNTTAIRNLNFDKPHIGYFQLDDVTYWDDVRLGIFIGKNVIDLTNGNKYDLYDLRAVKYGDYWIDFFTEDVMDEMSIMVGFPYDWEEAFGEDEEE